MILATESLAITESTHCSEPDRTPTNERKNDHALSPAEHRDLPQHRLGKRNTRRRPFALSSHCYAQVSSPMAAPFRQWHYGHLQCHRHPRGFNPVVSGLKCSVVWPHEHL